MIDRKEIEKYIHEQMISESKQVIRDPYKRAMAIVESHGYKVLSEGKMAKWIAGLALSVGLLTNAQASEFNAKTPEHYHSKATTAVFANNLRQS